MSDPAGLMVDLENAAKALDKAATRLADATREFEGGTDENGVWQPGPQLRFEELVAAEATAIYDAYEQKGERPPAETVRLAKARAIVKEREPDLYADYHRLRSEIGSLQKWMSAKKETISARQSVLSAEKTLSGAPQPQWSGERRAA